MGRFTDVSHRHETSRKVRQLHSHSRVGRESNLKDLGIEFALVSVLSLVRWIRAFVTHPLTLARRRPSARPSGSGFSSLLAASHQADKPGEEGQHNEHVDRQPHRFDQPPLSRSGRVPSSGIVIDPKEKHDGEAQREKRNFNRIPKGGKDQPADGHQRERNRRAYTGRKGDATPDHGLFIGDVSVSP